jgi:hypothetical protein
MLQVNAVPSGLLGLVLNDIGLRATPSVESPLNLCAALAGISILRSWTERAALPKRRRTFEAPLGAVRIVCPAPFPTISTGAPVLL